MEATMMSFDQASIYDSNSSEQREDGFNLINLLDPKPGCKILDLGCGTGYLTKALADTAGDEGEVIGIDPDKERLAVARQKHSATNLTYLEGSGEKIPEQGGNCDIVFSNSVLHWCKDKDLVFKNTAKVLKQGGKFGFVTPADFDAKKQFFTPAKMFSPECYEALVNHVHHASSETFLSIAAANNFKVTHFSKHLREWKFDSVEKLVEFHMTHYKGKFGLEHFDIEAMKQHYGHGSVTIVIPYITVVAYKLVMNY